MADIRILGKLAPASTDGVLAEDTAIKGGYKVVKSLTERDALIKDTLPKGTPVYVSEEDKTYRKTDDGWEEDTKAPTDGLESESDTLYVVDGSGNIVAKIDKNGVQSVDFILKDGQKVSENLGSGSGGINTLTEQSVRVWLLSAGVYSWSYDGAKSLLYSGESGTLSLSISSKDVTLFIQEVENYKTWTLLMWESTSYGPEIRYGYTDASTGMYLPTNGRKISNIPTKQVLNDTITNLVGAAATNYLGFAGEAGASTSTSSLNEEKYLSEGEYGLVLQNGTTETGFPYDIITQTYAVLKTYNPYGNNPYSWRIKQELHILGTVNTKVARSFVRYVFTSGTTNYFDETWTETTPTTSSGTSLPLYRHSISIIPEQTGSSTGPYLYFDIYNYSSTPYESINEALAERFPNSGAFSATGYYYNRSTGGGYYPFLRILVQSTGYNFAYIDDGGYSSVEITTSMYISDTVTEV